MGNNPQPRVIKPQIFENGKLEIILSKNEHFVGGKISGKIVLTLSQNFPSTKMNLKLLGVEKTSIIGLKRSKNASEKELAEHTETSIFCNLEKNILSTNAFNFQKGTFAYDFSFNLPSDIPSTFNHFCQNSKSAFSSRINFCIKADLTNKKTGHFLKAKLRFDVHANKTNFDGLNSTSVTHDFKSFATFLARKYITMGIKTDNNCLNATVDNSIFIDIDASHAQSSPINLKLMLYREFNVKSKSNHASCNSLIWEKMIANKLPKKYNYTGETGFLMILPKTVTNRLYESIKTKSTECKYFLKLIFEKNNNNIFTNFRDKHFELNYNFQLIRSKKPNAGELLDSCEHGIIKTPGSDLLPNDHLVYSNKRHETNNFSRPSFFPQNEKVLVFPTVGSERETNLPIRNKYTNPEIPLKPIRSNSYNPSNIEKVDTSGIPIYNVPLVENFDYPRLESEIRSTNMNYPPLSRESKY